MRKALMALLTTLILVGLILPVHYATAQPPSLSSDWIAESNQASANFGNAVANAGDVNGDGYDDVLVAAMWYSGTISHEGRVFCYYGSPTGLNATPNWIANGGQAISYFGVAVGSAGDVNNDGYDDVIIGACYRDNPQDAEGMAYVYYGSPSGLSTSPDWVIESNQAPAFLGTSVGTAGDVNGDGYDDIIVNAAWYDNGQTDEGAVFVYYGSPTGLNAGGTRPSGNPANSNWMAESNQAYALFGSGVATAGDVNNDGYDDIVVGALNYDNGQTDEGAAFIYYGSATGLNANGSRPSGTPANSDWSDDCDQAYAYMGMWVDSAGDVNNDNYDDVIVGAYKYDNGQTDEGRVFVYYGSSTGPSTVASWTAESNEANCLFGGNIGPAGDVNGDSYDDIIIGRDYYGVTGQGRAFIFYGSSTGLGEPGAPDNADWIAQSSQAGDCFPTSVCTAGDVNGDGYDDVIAGAYKYDNGQTDEGRAYLYYGSAPIPLPTWAEEFTADANTVALWHFNEGSGLTVNDASPGDHDGTIVGATWVDKGLGGHALDCGTGKYVEVPDGSGLDGMDELTIEAWVYLRSYPPAGLSAPIVSKYGTGYTEDDSYQFLITDTGQLALDVEDGNPGDRSSYMYSSDAVPLGQWTLVKGTWKKASGSQLAEIHLFINNEESVGIPLSIAGFHTLFVQDTSQPVQIGRGVAGVSCYFDGIIDEVRISNVARIEFDITEFEDIYASIESIVNQTLEDDLDSVSYVMACAEFLAIEETVKELASQFDLDEIGGKLESYLTSEFAGVIEDLSNEVLEKASEEFGDYFKSIADGLSEHMQDSALAVAESVVKILELHGEKFLYDEYVARRAPSIKDVLIQEYGLYPVGNVVSFEISSQLANFLGGLNEAERTALINLLELLKQQFVNNGPLMYTNQHLNPPMYWFEEDCKGAYDIYFDARSKEIAINGMANLIASFAPNPLTAALTMVVDIAWSSYFDQFEQMRGFAIMVENTSRTLFSRRVETYRSVESNLTEGIMQIGSFTGILADVLESREIAGNYMGTNYPAGTVIVDEHSLHTSGILREDIEYGQFDSDLLCSLFSYAKECREYDTWLYRHIDLLGKSNEVKFWYMTALLEGAVNIVEPNVSIVQKPQGLFEREIWITNNENRNLNITASKSLFLVDWEPDVISHMLAPGESRLFMIANPFDFLVVFTGCCHYYSGLVDLINSAPNEFNYVAAGTQCPVDLRVVDPDGLITDKESVEIEGSSYLEADTDHDGDLDDTIRIPLLKVGDYQVVVIPEPGSLSNDYTVWFYAAGQYVVLAKESVIQDMSPANYVVQLIGEEFVIHSYPVANADGPYASTEGFPIDFDAAGSYDPDGIIMLYEWDFDDDGLFDTSSAYPTATYTWGDDYSGNVTLRITDDDSLSSTDTAEVTVNNVQPTVHTIIAPTDPVAVNKPVNAWGNFTDQGWLDTHTATWNWGDGSTSDGAVTEANGSGNITGSHTYNCPGVYIVKLTVTDDDQGSGEAVFQYVVVYDPVGGFVTGGGWINSSLGAYTLDPSLTGKATFGFVSKYQKGANVPTGNTQFQFHAANMDFKSTSYQWLVIAGAKAQYKGSGTINGAGDYGFMLTAIDGQINGGGGIDKFRIKIWDKTKTTDNIVYDNQIGATDTSDTATPITAIAGGSIVIHK